MVSKGIGVCGRIAAKRLHPRTCSYILNVMYPIHATALSTRGVRRTHMQGGDSKIAAESEYRKEKDEQ